MQPQAGVLPQWHTDEGASRRDGHDVAVWRRVCVQHDQGALGAAGSGEFPLEQCGRCFTADAQLAQEIKDAQAMTRKLMREAEDLDAGMETLAGMLGVTDLSDPAARKGLQAAKEELAAPDEEPVADGGDEIDPDEVAHEASKAKAAARLQALKVRLERRARPLRWLVG
jgi:hypothetical protein